MAYPLLEINLDKIKFNLKEIQKKCAAKNLELVVVQKLLSGSVEMATFLSDNGVSVIADSRVSNLKNFKNVKSKKMLLRIPMHSEIEEVSKFCDFVLISEISTIKKLEQSLQKIDKKIGLILMIETGDIREGLWDEQKIMQTASEVKQMKNVYLHAIGTNFACYGATCPTIEKLEKLAQLKKNIEKVCEMKIPTISGGSSTHLTIWDDKVPAEINQIRVGSAVLMGIGLNDERVSWLKGETFKLKAEIIEVQDKPSASWGPRALDAFAREVNFEDIGVRKKAIIALGRQDCPSDEIVPVDPGIKVLGSSSDHTILDITDSNIKYQVGDIIEFIPTYLGNLSLTTSNYVEKKFIKN
ncbi:alanine racemase [Spiroplasma endosymbiont of Panorpa germanica]|uniref:alanine racemase n=1 Tax=Spiroplasma endosymbiont of Panorpa germanica TaxID=3066314 RepID=UPI0030CE4E04